MRSLSGQAWVEREAATGLVLGGLLLDQLSEAGGGLGSGEGSPQTYSPPVLPLPFVSSSGVTVTCWKPSRVQLRRLCVSRFPKSLPSLGSGPLPDVGAVRKLHYREGFRHCLLQVPTPRNPGSSPLLVTSQHQAPSGEKARPARGLPAARP